MAGKTELSWADFTGPNAAYLQDLYERYLSAPDSLPPGTREFFQEAGPVPGLAPTPAAEATPSMAGPTECNQVAAAVTLAMAIRAHGYRAAQLDPLGSPPPGDSSLEPETHGIRESDLASIPASVVGGPAAEGVGNALSAIRKLRKIYQRYTGYDFEHISNAEERAWLREAVESGRFAPPHDPINERKLLDRLTDVGSLERFLQNAYPGQTRFSLEGLGMMVPMLDEIVGAAAEVGTHSLFLGMAHRGRLNVLAHTLGKPYDQIIGEFMGRYRRSNISRSGSSDEGWTGDVKYHLGARKAYKNGKEVETVVCLAPNPSHLEYVNPVVAGMTRAFIEQRDHRGAATQDDQASLALVIHGDAAFPGEGIVPETLNLSRLAGYSTGGTIHLIANNQLGFTTPPHQSRSTLFASDLAKGFEIPILHVNADQPEACITAARLAHAYRERFRKDVLIDLIGYRRWGHNEGDEPSFTQPELYDIIRKHPTVRELWAAELVRRKLITEEEAQAALQAAIERLHAIRKSLQAEQSSEEKEDIITSGLEAGGTCGGLGHQGVAAQIETAVPQDELARLNQELYAVPEQFHIHPKVERPFATRRSAFAADAQDARIEWAHAEALAFASIISEGTPIRLSGQDSERGTFSQRHLVLHDSETGQLHVPLQALPSATASFNVWNSPLTEQAVLAFEFGYSVQAAETLVLWEAQYGDFVNVAQAVIDQFVASARSKWEQTSALVMLLPHGYEGQGPEHSSARLERFLQEAAEDNLRIANCTTAAQYFHLLRRQKALLSQDPRPLILLTPKSLLRHPMATSAPSELVSGRFHPVLDDDQRTVEAGEVRRLVLCSGKIYFDLVAARQKLVAAGQKVPVAAARIEELYPFPAEEVIGLLQRYPNLEEVAWVQEEPRNMGAWTYAAPRVRDILRDRLPLLYIGRTRRASTSEGSFQWHVREQTRLIEAALSGIGVGRQALGGAHAAGEDEVE